MLNAFRQFTKSKFGLLAVFVFLVLIAIAFAASDVTGLRSTAAGASGSVLAKVGGRTVTERELQERIDVVLGNLRRQGRSLTMQDFIAQGGVELALEQTINSVALEEFAKRSGMNVSTRLVDGEIASIPAFQGVDGKFDPKAFEARLAQERVSPLRLREDMKSDRYGQWLVNRVTAGSQVPDGLIAPYAGLMLERRIGVAGLVRRDKQDPGPDPDAKGLTAFYNANRARYTVPQRRVLLYALVRPDQFKAQSAATEAEIADAYKRSGSRYAATEKRDVRQLVLIDQATANAAAAEIRGGKSIAEAASARGLEARSFDGIEKAALARETAPAVADAAFAAAPGAVAGPVRSPLGWAVLKVEKVEAIAARTLDQAREELAAEISKRKEITLLADLRQSIEDGIGDGRTFPELMRDTKLTPARTAPVIAAGTDPDAPDSKPDPAIAEIVRAGFTIEQDDREPQLVPIGQEGGFAVVAIDRVVQAAPRPLDSIRAKVLEDYRIDQSLKKARAVAQAIVKAIAGGTPAAKAFAEGGASAATSFNLRRNELGANPQPQQRLAFTMAPGKAKLAEAPGAEGYIVVYLEKVESHDATGDARLMAEVRAGLGEQVGRERAMQFVEAIKKQLVVTQDKAAIDRFKARLTAGPSGN